jgi:hypothetical protein
MKIPMLTVPVKIPMPARLPSAAHRVEVTRHAASGRLVRVTRHIASGRFVPPGTAPGGHC